MRSSSRSPRVVAALLLLAAAAGCSSSKDVTGTGTTVSRFYVRLVQGVGDAPGGLTFAINGQAVLAGFGFGLVVPDPGTTDPYADIQVGSQIGFAVTGASTPFYNQVPAGVAARGNYTAVAYGRVTSGATPAAAVAVLADTSGVPASAGSLVRVFNAADYVTNAAGARVPVDVYVYAQGAARPSAPAAAGLALGARTAYLAEPAGALQVDVFAAGAAGTPLFTAVASGASGPVRTLVLLNPPPSASSTAVPGSVLVLNDRQDLAR